MITMEAMGLTEAQGVTDFMMTAIGEYSGCFYRGTTRFPDLEGKVLTNAEVVSQLAQGITFDGEPNPSKRRDLKTMSDSDAARFGAIWREKIVAACEDFQSKQTGQLKKVYQKMPVVQLAKIASARAWREAGQAVLAKMKSRQANQLSADGSGAESPAPHVSESYAKWRLKQYGVSEDRVYIATGQLMEDLSPDVPGRIQLVKGVSAVGRDEAAANVESAVASLKSFAGF